MGYRIPKRTLLKATSLAAAVGVDAGPLPLGQTVASGLEACSLETSAAGATVANESGGLRMGSAKTPMIVSSADSEPLAAAT